MARTVLHVLLGAVVFIVAAGVARADDDFDRVLPGDYRQMLLDAKNAYDGKRYDEAFHAFQRTACGGNKESQSALGRMYLLGQGVARDDLTGYAWLKVAAEVRFRGYQAIVEKIEHAMTPAQHAIADPEATRLIGLYGLRATKMSCNLAASQGGHIQDSIVCTPRPDGTRMLLRRCVTDVKPPGG
jgi:hypothetical protein